MSSRLHVLFGVRILAAAIAACCVLGLAAPAHAAHPLANEDTGTQGLGKFELEIGWQRARDDEARAMELGTQLSYGVTDTFDAIVRPTLLDVRDASLADGNHVRGFGDTSFGFKWRAFDGDPVSAGIRADIIAPTGSAARGLGLGSAGYHAVAIVSADADDWKFHGNVAYNRVPALAGLRRDLVSVSGAALWSANEALRVSLELITSSPAESDTQRWSLAGRLGVIASVASWLDVDVGYQARLNHAGPQSIVLAGATFRW